MSWPAEPGDIMATTQCPGGCGEEYGACGCYVEGYSDGKDKAHFETREMTADHDWRNCGCEPCITVRAVLKRTGALIRMPGERSRS